jgi:hypothetical protein
LIASAKAIARSLTAIRIRPAVARGAALYVHPAPGRIAVDGFADDWTALLPFEQSVGMPERCAKVAKLAAFVQTATGCICWPRFTM